MAKEHKIDWLNMPGYKGESWNPIVGCSKCSDGCTNCYAERMAGRICHCMTINESVSACETLVAYTNVLKIDSETGKSLGWNGQTALNESALEKPLHWKQPRCIFVCDMGDLFHESVDFTWYKEIFSVIWRTLGHKYLMLTKRPEQMAKVFTVFKCPPNVGLGVTVCTQKEADEKIPQLLKIPAAMRFVSIEPMLEEMDLYFNVDVEHPNNEGYGIPAIEGLDWVICGGESGHNARPMHPDWARSLRDQCAQAGVPFFFKQWGEYTLIHRLVESDLIIMPDGVIHHWQAHNAFETNRMMHKEHGYPMKRVGKKNAGCKLDGREYKEFPEW